MIAQCQRLKKWVLNPAALGLIVTTTIACQPQSLPKVTSSENPIPAANLVSQKQAIYRSDRYGFQFSYSPKDFVVDEKTNKPSSKDNLLTTIDIWTQQHAKKIRSGAYAGGTEYPANVSVRVYKNPQNLPLQKWVQQSNQFGITRDFKNTKIAGKNAIAFQSSGLYENENIIFSIPRSSHMIVITFAKTNYGNNDAIYKKAFDQVVNTFTFVGK
ncbi:hypothetical protein CEN40_14730 [Fischerella thermalis CCMEE 5205]|uniref:DUF1795 domain-containing protein n=1 Tax=Fischerella thermalis CCMEE 5318 TaxID=2019666 RepID=A0A2N6L8K3_9CYAN|nr:hypothetical protein [Fischerella thermalis]PMB18539.1 hypothetical protein CEN46_20910 [Fischerella thermalis CCMEE 5318]PMB44006.1 hypothetical protein CEN40_14730 [Fischerella thermalis CCMEE 5205]